MIDIVIQRSGSGYIPFSEEDRKAGLAFPENRMLRAKITGAKKERSYRELCCYFGSCQYIADLNLDDNKNTQDKVDHLTRLKCGFVEDTVFDDQGLLHWITKSLSYENCDSPDAHSFIKDALEKHAELVDMYDVDKYVAMLRELKGV
ncbi:hypothetical protein CMI37_36780 [Candidatus Pacearchaeota archaeon]|nr:hypothetical protein [Candidatus Pacearchaeota archaeon]|tara:strand:+ start:143 stop:583 length:441 start_codon:yes stop_codon:yes gene_type:complete